MCMLYLLCLARVASASLVGEGGGLVCELVGKAGLLLDHFYSQQSRESVDRLSLAIRILVLSPLPSGRVRLTVSC